MLHVVYRSYGGENTKGRPEFYSKLLALLSMVRCLKQLQREQVDLIFLNDGPIPSDRLNIMEKTGEVLARSGLGLKGSLHAALELPTERRWSRDDLVWFSEDDYLYQPRALADLVAAATVFTDASYFGLYALIGSRLPNGETFDDVGRVPGNWVDSVPKLVNGHPWRNALSTTSTFGARVGAIVDDRAMMLVAMKSGGAWDHTTCLMYQGHLPYPISSLVGSVRDQPKLAFALRRFGIFTARVALNAYQVSRTIRMAERRRLVAADPALITHLEAAYMAVGTDWPLVARETADFAGSLA